MRPSLLVALAVVLLPAGVAAQGRSRTQSHRIPPDSAARSAMAAVADTLKARPGCWPGVGSSTLAAKNTQIVDAGYVVYVTSTRARDQVHVTVDPISGSVLSMDACPWGAAPAQPGAVAPRSRGGQATPAPVKRPTPR